MSDPASPREGAYREGAPRSRPLLTSLPLATECELAWDSMTGAGRVRRCAKCSRQVFNITGLSLADAEVLVHDRLEAKDPRFHRRFDGTIMVGDCPRGLQRRRFRRAGVVVIVGIVMLSACYKFVGTLGHEVNTAVHPNCTDFPKPCGRGGTP